MKKLFLFDCFEDHIFPCDCFILLERSKKKKDNLRSRVLMEQRSQDQRKLNAKEGDYKKGGKKKEYLIFKRENHDYVNSNELIQLIRYRRE